MQSTIEIAEIDEKGTCNKTKLPLAAKYNPFLMLAKDASISGARPFYGTMCLDILISNKICSEKEISNVLESTGKGANDG